MKPTRYWPTLLHHGTRWASTIALLSIAGCQQVEQTQSNAASGPMHVAVVQPHNVVAALQRLGEFSQMQRALVSTGQAEPLSRRTTVTLLAPRDTAFVQLGPDWMSRTLDPANRATLATALTRLTLPRILRAEELRQLIDAGGGSVELPGDSGPLTFTRQGEQLYVSSNGGRASMGTQEITTDNGVVYVLDHWIG